MPGVFEHQLENSLIRIVVPVTYYGVDSTL